MLPLSLSLHPFTKNLKGALDSLITVRVELCYLGREHQGLGLLIAGAGLEGHSTFYLSPLSRERVQGTVA